MGVKMDNKEYVRAWQERVGRVSAHLELTDYLNGYKDYLVKHVGVLDLAEKTIVDFGCGGGWIGKYFPEIKQYIGIDIAARSIEKAKENNPNSEFFQIIPDKPFINIKNFDIDIFICLNVIHHFPDKEYFDFFFKELNQINTKQILLNIRENEETTFRENPYATTNDIGNACKANYKDVKQKLTKFKLTEKSKNGEFLYMYFEAK